MKSGFPDQHSAEGKHDACSLQDATNNQVFKNIPQAVSFSEGVLITSDRKRLTNADTHKQCRYEDGQVPVDETPAWVVGRLCDEAIYGAGYRTTGHNRVRKCSRRGQIEAQDNLQNTPIHKHEREWLSRLKLLTSPNGSLSCISGQRLSYLLTGELGPFGCF